MQLSSAQLQCRRPGVSNSAGSVGLIGENAIGWSHFFVNEKCSFYFIRTEQIKMHVVIGAKSVVSKIHYARIIGDESRFSKEISYI